MKFRTGVVFVSLALGVLVGCTAPGVAPSPLPEAPGLWMGLWHGFILPITFVVSLFNHDVGVYAVVNSGGWYNFGFFLGVAVSLGGGGVGARRRRKD